MLSSRHVVRFLVRFLLVYVLLMLPWPGVADGYRVLFINGWRVLIVSFASAGSSGIESYDDAQHDTDSRLWVQNRRSDARVQVDIDSRQTGYLPTVVTLSLILATPTPWRRRGRALCWGLTLVHVFVGLRLAALVLYGAHRPLPDGMDADPTLTAATVGAAVTLFGVGHGVSYIVPVVIWVLVSVRRGDLAMLAGSARPRSPGGAHHGSS